MSTVPAAVPSVDRRVLAVGAAVLACAAVAGYLVGHRPPPRAAREQTQSASVAGALLDFPAAWQPSPAVPAIKGLPLEHPLLLVPAGSAGQAGLLGGALPAGEPGPLPREFLVAAGRSPQTSVVNLEEAQAYRYSGLTVPGTDQALTLYVIPNPGGNTTALACYASPPVVRYLQACDAVVARLTLVGAAQPYELTPQPGYAGRLSAAIASLDQARTALRREMSAHVGPVRMARRASRLAQAYAQAAASVSALEPAIPAGASQGQLAAAILQAHAAYVALERAAHGRDQGAFALARTRVEQTETAVDQALGGFGLLGYQPA